MELKQRLNEAMKQAMKSKDSLRLNTIRLARTAIKNREIDQRAELDDDAVIAVLSTLVKQRRESAQVYRDNQRPELAEKEEQELAILQEFLPAQLDAASLASLVDEVVAACGASSAKDMGRVMKEVMAKAQGRADGRAVSELVKARLSG